MQKISSSLIDKIVIGYTNEAKVDFVGLWQVSWYLEEIAGIKSDAEIKDTSLIISRGLINNGVCPGYMTEDNGFDFWEGTPDELVAQIAASWPKTGIPDLSTDHCWFAKRSSFDAKGNNLVCRPSLGGKLGA